jgi:folate-binding Fe-S cluster repair protein YgfZ
VLPAEARLEHAVSFSKGCYVGQEIVARVRTRGSVNHLLVGLRFEGEAPPAPGTELRAAGRRVGEVTSVARSDVLGAIGLGFVRREHALPGTGLDADGTPAQIRALPPEPDPR